MSNVKFTEEQHAILNADFKQHIIVSACAGSGKTTTMLERVKSEVEYLKDSGDNREISILTFTNASKNDIRKRINDNKDVLITTFHGFFISHVLRFDVNLTENSRKITSDYTKNVNSNGEWERELYNNYLISTARDNMRDFLLEHSLSIIRESQSCRDYLKCKFSTIYIDEAQDNNQIQYDILEELIKLEINLFLVGDPWQVIFQFRGANAEKFIELTESEKYKCFELTQNFRCTPEINELANTLELPSKSKFDKENAEGYLFISKNKFNNWVAYNEKNGRNSVVLRGIRAECEELVKSNSSFKFIRKHPVLEKENNSIYLDELLRLYFNDKNEFKFLDTTGLDSSRKTLVTKVRNILLDITEETIKSLNYELFQEYNEYICSDKNIVELLKCIQDEDVKNYYTYSEEDNLVMTIHTAKGLEFDSVGIYAEDFFTWENDFRKEMYYVSCTRARKVLTIFHD